MSFQEVLIKSLEINGPKTAIEAGTRKLSYTDLLRAANRVTSFLLHRQLNNEIIALRLEDRVDMICAIVGIINARCVFAPLDLAWPNSRLRSAARDLRVEYVISDRRDPGIGETLEGAELIFWEDLVGNSDETAPIAYPACEPGDSLYIYFTSGTTGTPKGLIGRNGSLLQFLQWEIRAFGIDGDYRFSQFVSPYFDAFLRDIFVPLLAGATICIPSAKTDLDSPENMVKWIDESHIGLIHCVPSLFRLFNNDLLLPEYFQNLKYILLSGEKIIPFELQNWYRVFGDRIKLVNLYGATESTMIRSCYLIQPGDAFQARIPIGSPIDGTELLIVKSGFEPCIALNPGRLYIVSDYITKGYLNDPERTHEKFVIIPSGPEQGKMAFRTGDIARAMLDGKIELLGREDRQVKLRGIRIELDEIEFVLVQSGLLKEAAVVKQEEDNGNELLIAFIIRHAKLTANDDLQDAVKKYMKEHLPEQMIPSNIIEVEEISLLSSGKVNYKKLLDQLNTDAVVEPENELEIRLLAIWKEILDDKPISVEESFHRLGGNSLNMIKLMARIYKEYRVRIQLSELFNHNTIRKQAEFIKKAGRENMMIILPAGKKPSYYPSLTVERMYYHWTLDKNSTAFNMPLAWKVSESMDKERIRKVIDLLIQRHESLMTIFTFENGKLMQVVKDHIDFELEALNGREGRMDDAIAQFIRPFDLNNGPLIRAGLIDIDDPQKVLVIDAHHIVCDGLSLINLAEDFWKLYDGMALIPLRIQYKDYAEWEYNFRNTEMYVVQREFWLKSFESGIPEMALPPLKQRNTGSLADGGTAIRSIERDKMDPWMMQLQQEGITPSSILFAAFSIFMTRLSGQNDIVIGTGASGRVQDELEGVVGMFVKTLPIRCHIDPSLSFREFAAERHRYLMQAYSMQLYDLADIAGELQKRGDALPENLIEAMFVYLNVRKEEVWQQSDRFSSVHIWGNTAKFPVTFYFDGGADPMVFRFEYSSAYFTKSGMEALAMQFKDLLETIAVNMDVPMARYIGEYGQPHMVPDENITFNF